MTEDPARPGQGLVLVVELLGALLLTASFAILIFVSFLGIGVGMTCENQCGAINLWFLSAVANLFGQVIALVVTVARLGVVARGYRRWVGAGVYVVSSLSANAIFVWWFMADVR
jgi:hypothetical protein